MAITKKFHEERLAINLTRKNYEDNYSWTKHSIKVEMWKKKGKLHEQYEGFRSPSLLREPVRSRVVEFWGSEMSRNSKIKKNHLCSNALGGVGVWGFAT
ncbi:hypothetical protein QVD17_11652 [Tagetes erecta]|uniref:Uncharacterized protein n=1 Tax=Tagetes erecta TaxID=13708 RepID=A0AAD8KXP6_TARER|nr:hypothetical protein QVD17_11652 [Tagetes erecta]